MASLSLVLRYVFVLTFFILLSSQETFSSRLVRSLAEVTEIGADDYPSTGRNTPVRDLGFPDFPSFQEAMVAPPPPPPDLPLLPPPPPDMPLLPPPPPDMPLLPPPPPDMPLLPPPPPDLPLLPPPSPPTIPSLEEPPRVPVPVWPALPEFLPFPFIEQPPPSEPFGPRFDESGNVIPSSPSNPLGFP
ncbi:hypothetical protein AALP_AA1G314800 [Arabis alpina]|uniref:Hydroxyproline-rich glycoprotein family protein n=1 Tax=Arabis alpina TaxID=50452 RepID=A0A087HRX7_ARAAL|nr:hypothetical protein AALP_AA1G314800 [Arabis alpina]